MSNGSQIGGAVGAIVGGIIGLTTGNWKAVQWGYAIGSAVGGYVDPTKVYGPRLEDASAQTSTVGGVIPFGYGVFTCAGNIIWADQLIEHKKSERVGKGGGQKNITYTYTRSYAIGVCEGQIHNYLWIKKNGKLIYAVDPAGLGAAMGWDSKQISDLAAASTKFLQETTLYYGTDSQMPDSTIVAVEGVGNVSPFRDLAYIVKENEDLTDTAGAVSQHEFCIRATPPEAYLTSNPYPQYYSDQLDSVLTVTGGELRTVLHFGDISPDKLVAQLASTGGEIKDPPNGIFKDGASSTLIARGGELKLPRAQRMAPDAIENALIANGGELLIPPSGTVESDSVDGALVATGGELSSGWIVSALYELTYENHGSSGINFRLRIPAADMPAGTKVRLTLRGASSGGFKVTTAHFGRAATSGDPYDFASAPTQVKFGGANSVTIAATTAVVTDEITMTITGTNDYLLAVYCNDGNNNVMPYGGSFGGQVYYRVASNQSSATNVSGYTNWGGLVTLVEKIEIYTS